MKKPELLILGVDGVAGSYVKGEVEKGNLPGFARMMKNGVFFNDMASAFPSITPTCWHTIYSGAMPKVHGAADELIHVEGTAPWELRSTYSAKNSRAEKFWECAAKIGKRSLLLEAMGAGEENRSK